MKMDQRRYGQTELQTDGCMDRRKKTRRKIWMYRWQSSPLYSIANAHLKIGRLKIKLIVVYCGSNTLSVLPCFWLRCPPSTTVSHTYTFMIPIIHFGEAGKNSFAAGFYRSEYGGYLWSHFTTSFFICDHKNISTSLP